MPSMITAGSTRIDGTDRGAGPALAQIIGLLGRITRGNPSSPRKGVAATTAEGQIPYHTLAAFLAHEPQLTVTVRFTALSLAAHRALAAQLIARGAVNTVVPERTANRSSLLLNSEELAATWQEIASTRWSEVRSSPQGQADTAGVVPGDDVTSDSGTVNWRLRTSPILSLAACC